MPSRQGWKIIENPCTGSSRGPYVKDIVHNTIIWHSNDKTQLGLSDIKGENFRTFKFKSTRCLINISI